MRMALWLADWMSGLHTECLTDHVTDCLINGLKGRLLITDCLTSFVGKQLPH